MSIHFLPPTTDPYETAVEDAIAACNGDTYGALKVLIIANEFLERELLRVRLSPPEEGRRSPRRPNSEIGPAVDHAVLDGHPAYGMAIEQNELFVGYRNDETQEHLANWQSEDMLPIADKVFDALNP